MPLHFGVGRYLQSVADVAVPLKRRATTMPTTINFRGAHALCHHKIYKEKPPAAAAKPSGTGGGLGGAATAMEAGGAGGAAIASASSIFFMSSTRRRSFSFFRSSRPGICARSRKAIWRPQSTNGEVSFFSARARANRHAEGSPRAQYSQSSAFSFISRIETR